MARSLLFGPEMERANYVSIEGQILRLTHLDKVLYPNTGFTKRELIEYYRKVAPVALPYLRNRPFTLKRYPSGVEGEHFYEKSCPSHRPRWVQTAEFQKVRYCVINDLKSLIWAANLAAIELHTTLAIASAMDRPDFLAFDLDPGEGAGLAECAEVALLLRDYLADRGLESFPKTSGKKGMHVYLPLDGKTPYSEATRFARLCAENLALKHRDRITSRMPKKYRGGKVFIDWSQNVDFKSTVCPYSLRATDRPVVSTPLKWSEVRPARASELVFGPAEVFKRLEKWGDLFAPVLRSKQSLPESPQKRRAA
jgi:bifunctional non-homologous end joining protein LigD